VLGDDNGEFPEHYEEPEDHIPLSPEDDEYDQDEWASSGNSSLPDDGPAADSEHHLSNHGLTLPPWIAAAMAGLPALADAPSRTSQNSICSRPVCTCLSAGSLKSGCRCVIGRLTCQMSADKCSCRYTDHHCPAVNCTATAVRRQLIAAAAAGDDDDDDDDNDEAVDGIVCSDSWSDNGSQPIFRCLQPDTTCPDIHCHRSDPSSSGKVLVLSTRYHFTLFSERSNEFDEQEQNKNCSNMTGPQGPIVH